MDLEAAQSFFEESLALRRELGNEEGIAHLLNNLAIIAMYRGQIEESRALHRQALALCRELGNRWLTAVSLSNFGYMLLTEAEYEAAREKLTEAVALLLFPQLRRHRSAPRNGRYT